MGLGQAANREHSGEGGDPEQRDISRLLEAIEREKDKRNGARSSASGSGDEDSAYDSEEDKDSSLDPLSPLKREELDVEFFAEFGHLISKKRAKKAEGETSEEDKLSTGSYDSKGPKELREVTTLHN